MLYFDGNANYPVNKDTKQEYVSGMRYHNISATDDPIGRTAISALHTFLSTKYGLGNVIFTSGGSESNSTIIHQFVYKGKPTILCPSTTHSSTTDYLIYLANDGRIELRWHIPHPNGEFDIQVLQEQMIGIDLFFCQSVDSETGTIHPIFKFKQMLPPTAKFAVDDVQGFMKADFPHNCADYVSVSFHKIGGVIGTGALMTRDTIIPLIYGKQHSGQRGGTLNLPGIMAANCAIREYRNNSWAKVFLGLIRHPIMTYSEFMSRMDSLPPTYFIRMNSSKYVLPNVLLLVAGKNTILMCAKMVKMRLMEKGYLIGTGSACNAESTEPILYGSLASTDIIEPVKKGFLRISFVNNTKADVTKLATEFNHLF